MQTISEHSSHLNKINSYVNWLFKDKKPFVVLKQYNNKVQGTVKMFIALPVSKREFEVKTLQTSKGLKTVYEDLFNPQILDNTRFEFKQSQIINYNTIYSGDIFKFYGISSYLSRFIFHKKSSPLTFHTERIPIFKDYTKTLQEQKDILPLITCFTEPDQSVNSIYRLLHTKYVTIIDIEFKQNT